MIFVILPFFLSRSLPIISTSTSSLSSAQFKFSSKTIMSLLTPRLARGRASTGVTKPNGLGVILMIPISFFFVSPPARVGLFLCIFAYTNTFYGGCYNVHTYLTVNKFMFSIKESIKYGWLKLKEHTELVLYATLLVLAVSSLNGGIGRGNRSFVIPVFNLVVIVFSIIIKIGYNKIFLKIYDGEKPKFVEIFKEYRIFWRYVGVSILRFLPLAIFTVIIFLIFSYAVLPPLAILCTITLLTIFSIIWTVRFSFSLIIIIDTKTSPIAAMRESYAITKDSFWKILLFWIVTALFNLLGLLLFWVGLLVTVPITTFASIYIYRELSKAKAGLIQNVSPQQA